MGILGFQDAYHYMVLTYIGLQAVQRVTLEVDKIGSASAAMLAAPITWSTPQGMARRLQPKARCCKVEVLTS